LIATLRDTQSYVRSAEMGVGVYEMPAWQVQQDLSHWRQVLNWIAEKRRHRAERAATPRNLVSIERASAELERSMVEARGGHASAVGHD
jgi:hypothetical protein